MKRSEIVARLLVLAGLALVIVPFVVKFSDPTLELHAHMAENGGWTPDVIRVEAGRPLHLRLTSDDVLHGFAVGQTGMEPVDAAPGKMTDLTLVFDKPGRYTFYCTRWCGADHWRMRGTIEVTGAPDDINAPARAPLYIALGLDIDAPHLTETIPDHQPSATHGRELAESLDLVRYFGPEYYRSHSPAQAYLDLRADPETASLGEAQIWDLVAWLWVSQTSSGVLAEGRTLYAQNCAACHGEQGAGDGVFADDIAADPAMSGMPGMAAGKPADFTDPNSMLGASPALLQGKLLRGGMGTGMPMWGAIFADDETWALVSYLYTFQFQENSQ